MFQVYVIEPFKSDNLPVKHESEFNQADFFLAQKVLNVFKDKVKSKKTDSKKTGLKLKIPSASQPTIPPPATISAESKVSDQGPSTKQSFTVTVDKDVEDT